MYAIVKAGGRQEKVAVGDTVYVDRIDAAVGSTVSFPALLVVDGDAVTSDPKVLSGVKVTGEIVAEVKGPKIHILRYKRDRKSTRLNPVTLESRMPSSA